MLLARIAVPVPLGQMFSYSVPESLAAACVPGSRVLCGWRTRHVLGVVIDIADREPEIDAARIKPIIGIIDPEPVFPLELLSFLVELGRYYLAPMGEVMRLALPAVERQAQEPEQLKLTRAKQVGHVRKLARGLVPELPMAVPLKGNAKAIYEYLLEQGARKTAELSERWSNAGQVLNKLATLGLVAFETTTEHADPFLSLQIQRDQAPELNEHQLAAVAAMSDAIDAQQSSAFLLHGVTASGKTEVYIHAVAHCLERGRGALVLVPEIALTPQLVARFRARLGERIAVLHSGLRDGERHAMWKRLRSGELRVAIGARSALFAPVLDLGLICVDEEHDSSFKQEEGVRYHARDMAILRAHRARGVCVLGSATPSLASEYLVQKGQVTRLRLPTRARKSAGLPEIEIVDLRRMGKGPTGDRLITLPLRRAIERALAAHEQVIVFLNRRGFAPSLICDDCGVVAQCPDCSVALTVHRTRRPTLVCHYCGHQIAQPTRCEACKSTQLAEEGSGTERIEEILSTLFPAARVERLDRDVAAGVKSEKVLDRMRRGEIDILVGTQMVTKGHDLPDVTLVGVLDADAALSLPDFRAAERTFQLLVQVAGRAGRADKPGHVLVQTRQPESAPVRFALSHDVDGFIEHEIAEREELQYPPYSRLGLVRCEGLQEDTTRLVAEQLASIARAQCPRDALAAPRAGDPLKHRFSNAPRKGTWVEVVGPSPAPIAKIRNRYRYRFLVKSSERQALRQILLAVLRAPIDRRVQLIVDVDPMSML
ncbi:MAG TPA: primosomal protein N' [Polyangiaceae bacterium]